MSNADVRISEPGPSMSPLAAWNDGATRKAIIDFVARVVDPGSSDFVKPADRIAVFDNDGTLWCEQPLIQGIFIMQRLAEMAKDDDSLRAQQPWKAAYENDSTWVNQAVVKHYGGDESDMKVLLQGSLKAFADIASNPSPRPPGPSSTPLSTRPTSDRSSMSRTCQWSNS